MISDKDRSYFIGASDTAMVVGNWNTKTFEKWYLEKEGFITKSFTTEAMMTGTAYEHRIIDSLNIPGIEKDNQIIIGRLRVNLDGNTNDTIYEIKTHKASKTFKIPKNYREQVWVQMYAFGIMKAYIVAYGLIQNDYKNFYRDIDPERITFHEIKYNPEFINEIYLPRLNYLSECLDNGMFPKMNDVKGSFRKE